MIQILAWMALGLLTIAAAMASLNSLFAGRLNKSFAAATNLPLVSVLIPVRNEADNLRRLLPALNASRYEKMEVIVLDDESEDGSGEIASSILQNAGFHTRVITGKSWSPELGLSGKSHACAQLADSARGEILIFCDADILPSPKAVDLTAAHMMSPGFREHAAGLSALPRQRCFGWRERLLIPWIMHLPLMVSVPLFCSWRLPLESLQMANGQWLAIYARDYAVSGGHRRLGPTPLEDVTLARLVHRVTGRGLRPVIATRDLTVTMYSDWSAMLAGFSKNLVTLGGGTPATFLAVILSINTVVSFPLWGWFVGSKIAAAGFTACLIVRLLTAVVFKMPVRDLLMHPVSLLLLDVVALEALACSRRGIYQWKGRVVKWSAT